jgi:hypothetical protein
VLLLASVALQTLILLWIWVVPVIVGQLFLRPYLLAEHTGCDRTRSAFQNTRTTYTAMFVRWSSRVLVRDDSRSTRSCGSRFSPVQEPSPSTGARGLVLVKVNDETIDRLTGRTVASVSAPSRLCPGSVIAGAGDRAISPCRMR